MPATPETGSRNSNLSQARRNKNDEFYTQFRDIEKEIEAYLEYDKNTFRDKVVYCNCDDPYESNFFKYFVLNFKKLGLKQLISTSYQSSPIANTQVCLTDSRDTDAAQAHRFIINEVGDMTGDGAFNLDDVAIQLQRNAQNEWEPLEGDGDFRSEECVQLLEQADIVVTNPPFSLFREYMAQLVAYEKQFIIIGNMNAITYKEIFPLIKDNQLWLGISGRSTMEFIIPTSKDSVKVPVCWFTNIDHGHRHDPLILMTLENNKQYNRRIAGNPHSYQKYDNYDAIEVPYTKAIPADYKGVMGVPISFLDKYCPEQFEILNANDYRKDESVPIKGHGLIKDKDGTIHGKACYVRILIKHKPQTKETR